MTLYTPTFSVIICAYTANRWADLCAAVDSVRAQRYQAQEIIVVIDHHPALLARAQEAFHGALVVENQHAQGLSGARNSGIEHASGSVVAFLDDDAIADEQWLEQLAATYGESATMIVGGVIEPSWQNKRPSWFPKEFDWVVGCTYVGMPERLATVRNVIGCNMSARREVFSRVGGFRIGRVGLLSLGQENDETELCIRVGSAYSEASILFQPTARVQHRVSVARETVKYFATRCYSEGISKAMLSRIAGANRSLSTERTYVWETLPRGVARGIADTACGDVTGIVRAGAIMLGLGLTGAGYVVGMMRQRAPRVANGVA